MHFDPRHWLQKSLAHMPRHSVAILGLLVLVCLPTAAAAEEYTVGLYAPSLDFADGVARNDYVSAVAATLESKTGETWKGKAYARKKDFESALDAGDLDVVVADAGWFSARGSRLTAVGSLTANGATKRSMKLYVKKGSYSQVHELRGKKLAIPDVPLMQKFVGGDVLGGEVVAADFFSKVDVVKDARAARNAVKLDKADAFLAFDGLGDGYTALYETSSVPLPVVAIAARFDGDLDKKVRTAARGLSASGGGLVTGSKSYDGGSVRSFKTVAGKKRRSRRPELVEPAEIAVTIGRMDDLERTRLRLAPTDGVDAFVLPVLDEEAM